MKTHFGTLLKLRQAEYKQADRNAKATLVTNILQSSTAVGLAK